MRTGSLPVLACLLALGVGGCGDDAAKDPVARDSAGQPGSSESTSVPDGPACDDVWVDGHELADNYKGCVQAGAWVAADRQLCESGQVLVVFADRYYGAKGAVVNDMGGPLDESKQFQRAQRSCG